MNLDGSASRQGQSADDLLDEFLAPFQEGTPDDDIAHLLAINDGRLLEWIERVEERCDNHEGTPLTRALSEVFRANRIFGPDVLADADAPAVRARARARLFEALQAVHLRGETHVTVRELLAALVYILFGVHFCGVRAPAPGLRPPAGCGPRFGLGELP